MRITAFAAILMSCSTLSSLTASAEQTYYGADVQVDSLGDASLVMGEITVRHGDQDIPIPLDPIFLNAHPGAPERAPSLHPGAPERMPENCHTIATAISYGDSLSMHVSLISDARSLANLADHTARIVFDIEVIDSATGEVLFPVMHVTVGNGPLVVLPPTMTRVMYDGQTSRAARVSLRARVEHMDSALYGIEGLIVYADQLNTPALDKRAGARSAPHTNAVQISPNPVHTWTQLTYSVERPGNIRVEIVDLTGRRVALPVDSFLNAGRYTAALNAVALPAGEYYVRMLEESALIGVASLVVRR